MDFQPRFNTQSHESSFPAAFSVTEINTMVADVLSASLPSILSIEGEISNLSVATSGHRYFSLKDANSTISCAFFRGASSRISHEILSNLKNGDKVVLKAQLSVYSPRGAYQLIVSDIEPAGFGALAKAFTELKRKLDDAGLTATDRKRPIPTWVNTVAVVTSSTGAAVRDVLSALERRAPFISVHVYSTLVQGQGAPEQIVQALAEANNDASASVILLVRGGGSLEDLQAFNHEEVAMAVANSRLPVVSGVGHETDFTIVDFVSDARAPTPTAAAEWVSPDKQALAKALDKQRQRLILVNQGAAEDRRQQLNALARRLAVQHPERNLQLKNQRLDELTSRIKVSLNKNLQGNQQKILAFSHRLSLQHPERSLLKQSRHLAGLEERLAYLSKQYIERSAQKLNQFNQRLMRYPQRLVNYQQQVKGLEARLTLLSPLGILARGYAVAFNAQGDLLRSVDDVRDGDTIRLRLANGELEAEVKTRASNS